MIPTYHNLNIGTLSVRLVLNEDTDAPRPGVVGGDLVGAWDVASELVHQDPVQHWGTLAQGTLRVSHYGGEGGQVADMNIVKYYNIFYNI